MGPLLTGRRVPLWVTLCLVCCDENADIFMPEPPPSADATACCNLSAGGAGHATEVVVVVA